MTLREAPSGNAGTQTEVGAAGPRPIPLFDLRIEPADIDAVTEALTSGWLTMGPRVEEFERAFAEHLGARHVIALSSGTAALHLAYRATGIGPGDEVIVPAFTFVATVNAVLYCGATPVFADIAGVENPSIDPVAVERLISARTRAIAAVHFAGYAAPVDALSELCREHGLALIEDAAHAPCGELAGRRLGTVGAAGAFSFFSNKVLGIGEGGALVTDDDEIAASARALRAHAMTSTTWDRHRGYADTYDVVDIGFNYRMDEARAALALARLARLEADVQQRRELTLRYRRRLADMPGIIVPFGDDDVAHSSCYVMPIMLTEAGRRADFRRVLQDEHGVQTSILYPAVHEFTAYRKRFPGVSLPRTEQAARCEITIPLYPHMAATEQDRVLTAVARALDA